MAGKLKPSDVDDLCRLYQAGNLECDLAKIFKITYQNVHRWLLVRGIPLRTIGDSHRIAAARSTKEERARRARAAHDAIRGLRRTMEDLCKRSKGKEIKQSHATRIEGIAVADLESHGLKCIPQKAIGPYNVDIAIEKPPIAVEIFGGSWHASGRHAARFRKRIDYLLDQGWLPIIVWVSRDHPLETGAIKYIVALAKKIRRGETTGRQEKMIRGDGQPCIIGERKFNNLPPIPSAARRNNATGRYTSRPGQ